MATKSLRIGHYADLQADVKEGFGYDLQHKIFRDTVEKFRIENVNVVVLAGDIFDKEDPTDSNRKLIYNHIVDVLKLDNVQEYVIMLGNHDYVKETKNKDVIVGSNPIDTLVDFIEKVEPNLSRKLTYLKKQDIYGSRYDSNINWFSYSLEDGKSNGDNFRSKYNRENIPTDKLNITIHHDIVREYIDKSKLPIPKSSYNKLISLNAPDAFLTELVLAGDIHSNIELTNLDETITYIYPGNIFERNYGEGSYITIRNKTTVKPSEEKVVNIYDIEYDTFHGKILNRNTKKAKLDSYVKFLTIDLNTVKIFDGFNERLIKALNEFEYPKEKLFIRFKVSNAYLNYEVGIRKLIQQLSELRELEIHLEFVYDKVVNKSDDSAVVNRMKLDMLQKDLEAGKFTETEFIALKSAIIDKLDLVAIANETGIDLSLMDNPDIQKHLASIKPIVENLSSDNIDENLDNVLLTSEQLKSLFKAQLMEIKPEIEKSMGNADLALQVINEINSLFNSEIDFLINTKPTYNIEPIYTENDSFMQLGYNKIFLDNPGRTRITGTNGVGKTTLYNEQRWVITGLVFPNLKVNQSVKNTLMVFNDEKPEIDSLFVRHLTKINGTKVEIVRRATRKWKQGATLADKQSIDWKKWISTAGHEVEVTIFKEDSEPQKFVGDKAQNLLDTWYGDVIDTIMIINQHRILEMLNKSGAELSSMILDYLADYLKNLENNLPKIKEKYNTKTPAFTLATLQADLVKIKAKSVEIEENSKNIVENLEYKKASFKEYSTKVNETNNELIKLGNVPEQLLNENNKLKQVENSINSNNELINNFEIKQLPIFNTVQPVLNENSINELTTQIDKQKENKVRLNDWVENFFKNYADILNRKIQELSPYHNELIQKYNNEFNLVSQQINESLSVLGEHRQALKFQVRESKTKLITDLRNLVNQNNTVCRDLVTKINSLITDKNNLQNGLDSNICSECKRPLEDLSKEHIDEINNKIESLNQEIIQLNIENTSQIGLSGVIDKVIKILETNGEEVDVLLNHNYNEFFEGFNNEVILKAKELIVETESLWNKIKTELVKVKNNEYVEQTTQNLLSQLGQPDINLSDNRINSLNNSFNEVQKHKVIFDEINNLLNFATSKKLVNQSFIGEYEKIQSREFVLELQTFFLGLLKFFESEKINATVNKFIETINNTDSEINRLNSEIQKINNEFNQMVKEYQEAFQNHTKLTEEINNHNLQINDLNNNKIQLDTQRNIIQQKIDELTEVKPKYDSLSLEYSKLQNELNDINNEINNLQNNYQKLEFDKQSIEQEANEIKKKEEEYLEYRKNKEIYKVYEVMIKKHFKNSVFAYYREFLNSTLNLLLEDLSFKLYWHEDGELYYRAIKDGKVVNRPVISVSGMQSLFLGLSLLFTISLLNNQSNISVLFIDEISGVLNSGKDLKEKKDIVNYQEQLLLLLNKFHNKNIFIIDHVIKNLFETCTYEVVATGEGSKYILID